MTVSRGASGTRERFGSTAVREAIRNGADPDAALRTQEPAVAAFLANARRFFLY